MGELTDRAKAAGNKIAGAAKEAAGDVTGNDRLKAEGAAQKLKGDAQNVSGKVKGALGDDI
ncbi:CsbD family protein [Novosphingobium olei]|uniref:CsbD family protein n=1 Tax=Novosphingobium olei TaxID=2728851 RepID=A0A7Y0G8F6_9SPHN|nr:CsbD family protein [Novosphingobium olei]NML92825.1 CsbD family protein [Novosphingobium olei]BEV01317.1 CsbD family protein [Novosphingobium olei]